MSVDRATMLEALAYLVEQIEDLEGVEIVNPHLSQIEDLYRRLDEYGADIAEWVEQAVYGDEEDES